MVNGKLTRVSVPPQITIHKDDECVLASNSHRAKWKVINPAGNEAMVPSVCFTVPPPNKEAVETAARSDATTVVVMTLHTTFTQVYIFVVFIYGVCFMSPLSLFLQN